MSEDGALAQVCVGDSVHFKVIAERREAKRPGAPSDGDEPTNPAVQVSGVTVDGSVLNPVYGKLKPASSTTRYAGILNATTPSTPEASAAFTFTGLRLGSTELRFTGVLASAPLKSSYRTYIPLKRDVNVVPCDSPIQPPTGAADAGAGSGASKDRKAEVKKVKPSRISKVKVTTRSTWSAGMDIVATIKDGVMVADGQGHFTGSANVTWWTSVIGSAGCGAAEYTVPPSKADLAGEFDENNQLVVTITFEPRDFAGFATCGRSISTSNLATPDPLTVSVPATGGTSTQAHAVTAKNGSFAGSATIVVTPERK